MNRCNYCGDFHIFSFCHKGIQLIKYMKDRTHLESRSIYELRWLLQHFKLKPQIRKKSIIDKLLSMEFSTRLDECPICIEEIKTENTVITACHHAFCDYCILKHIQKNDNCPICREPCNIIYLLSIIPKERIIEIYTDIYSEQKKDSIEQESYIYVLEEDNTRQNQQHQFTYIIISILISMVLFGIYTILSHNTT